MYCAFRERFWPRNLQWVYLQICPVESRLWHWAVPCTFTCLPGDKRLSCSAAKSWRPFYHLSFFYLKSITALNSRGGLWSWYVSKKGWRGGGLLINLRLDSNKNRHYLRVCYFIPYTWQVMRLEVALVMFMYAK